MAYGGKGVASATGWWPNELRVDISTQPSKVLAAKAGKAHYLDLVPFPILAAAVQTQLEVCERHWAGQGWVPLPSHPLPFPPFLMSLLSVALCAHTHQG